MGDVDDDLRLADALVMVAVRLPRVLRALDEAPQLSASEASALAVLVHGGAMNIGTLARHEAVRPPSMTRTVTRMEEKRLVRRRPDPLDGRGWVIEASARGRRLLLEGHARKLEPLVAWLHGLDDGQKQQLMDALPVLQAMSMLTTTETGTD
ncbi:MarR family transcriptional regulator [Luteimonas yindakuii]|uniref:MarR family transcriptional regulator n=1 Tax=Luteimonas yindakuii TaxID=2565782 RepID=A0A4Z1RIU9_9GAMM|nr:MarR family transcriptional regulator [Luteimonas yindakuii]TKS53571.1 MarR family transcriptional regulator [Luteimonas yindakuii]